MIEASHFDFRAAYAASTGTSWRTSSPTSTARATSARPGSGSPTGLPAGRVRAHREGRPSAPGTALRRHRARRVRVVRRRRPLAAAAAQPAGRRRCATSRSTATTSIVATHGRGFWVIDDISPLRQLDDAVAAADAYLFKPADAIDVDQGGDNGTPYQKDEPRGGESAGRRVHRLLPEGRRRGTGDARDSRRHGVRACTRSRARPRPPARGPTRPGIPNTTALWRPEPKAVLHGGRHASRDLAPQHRPAGAASAALAARGPQGAGRDPAGGVHGEADGKGKSYTQTFTVRPDPRRLEAGRHRPCAAASARSTTTTRRSRPMTKSGGVAAIRAQGERLHQAVFRERGGLRPSRHGRRGNRPRVARFARHSGAAPEPGGGDRESERAVGAAVWPGVWVELTAVGRSERSGGRAVRAVGRSWRSPSSTSSAYGFVKSPCEPAGAPAQCIQHLPLRFG